MNRIADISVRIHVQADAFHNVVCKIMDQLARHAVISSIHASVMDDNHAQARFVVKMRNHQHVDNLPSVIAKIHGVGNVEIDHHADRIALVA